MAVTIPASYQLPASPAGVYEPGLGVEDLDWLRITQSHNWLCGYWGTGHVAERYQGRRTIPVLNPGHVEELAGINTCVLEYLLVPRTGTLGITYRIIADTDAVNGCTITLLCPAGVDGDGTGAGPLVVGVGGAPVYVTGSWAFAAGRGDTLTRIQIWLQMSAGTYATIYGVALRDADVVAGSLP